MQWWIYQQINVFAMGLSVSPIMADIVIHDLGEKFLKRYKSILLYGRYVDISFIIIAKIKLNLLQKYANSYTLDPRPIIYRLLKSLLLPVKSYYTIRWKKNSLKL